MIHNRYRVRGGEDESTDAEVALLRSRGHEVRLLEAKNDAIEGVGRSALAALTTTWSRHWAKEVDGVLAEKHYDILHVQNFFPMISPSVYYAAARHAVPVVQSVRNYRLICASANLFRDDNYCADCVGRSFAWPGVVHRCYRGSLPGSAAIAAMQAAHRLIGTWKNKVAVYVALTNYVRDRLIEGGFPAAKIVVKPNFVMSPPPLPRLTRSGLHIVCRPHSPRQRRRYPPGCLGDAADRPHVEAGSVKAVCLRSRRLPASAPSSTSAASPCRKSTN